MKAIQIQQFGDPEVQQLSEVPNPMPNAGEVLVRIHAAGVNPVETYIRSGNYAKLPPLPYTPGNDGAGIVEHLGNGVSSIAVGDRVYVNGSRTGTYAEFAVCPATAAHPLPTQISFQKGAALGVPYATAYRALFHRGAVKPGETVLVHGATGGVGLAAVQFACAKGIPILATGGTEEGRALLRKLGATAVFDHTAGGYLDEIREYTKGTGVGLIIEVLANKNLANDLTLLGVHGRVVVVGSRGPIEINPRETMAREADIRGLMVGHATAEELRETHAAIFTGLDDGSLDPVIAMELPLADAARAHREVMGAHAPGKIVLVP